LIVAIVGIVIGVVALLIGVGLLLVFLFIRRRKQSHSSNTDKIQSFQETVPYTEEISNSSVICEVLPSQVSLLP
jgi:cytoskeletal protein RodZ